LENILLDSLGYVVVADFGLSKELAKGKKTFSYCGTVDYMVSSCIPKIELLLIDNSSTGARGCIEKEQGIWTQRRLVECWRSLSRNAYRRNTIS
jgi:hypothetical protein